DPLQKVEGNVRRRRPRLDRPATLVVHEVEIEASATAVAVGFARSADELHTVGVLEILVRWGVLTAIECERRHGLVGDGGVAVEGDDRPTARTGVSDGDHSGWRRSGWIRLFHHTYAQTAHEA